MTFKEEKNKSTIVYRLYTYNFYSFNNDKTFINNNIRFKNFPLDSITEDICGISINCKICFSSEEEKYPAEKKILGFNYEPVEFLIRSDVLKQISHLLKTNNNVKTINIKKTLKPNQISHLNLFMADYLDIEMSKETLMDKFVNFNMYNLKFPDVNEARQKMAEVIDTLLTRFEDQTSEFFYRSE